MKYFSILFAVALIFSTGCVRKKAENQAGMNAEGTKNPHSGMNMDSLRAANPNLGLKQGGDATSVSGGLDLDAMMANLPQGWTKSQPSSSMRVAEVKIAPAKGDTGTAEIAIFYFPGSGGSSAANISRWQNQMKGPKGEPGAQVAKTDTMMVGYLTVVTTDVSGTLIGSASMMSGQSDADVANQRMIASVIETPSGNWFAKMIGPQNTVTANEGKFRDFLKRAKVKEGQAAH